jgi:hypothetical protein
VTDRVQIIALAGSTILLLLILELVRRRRLAEEYSALWIVSALVLIGISLRRDTLDFAARWLGVYYPPAVLVLMLVGVISVASLSFSVILSRQKRQINWLIEENAIMAAELRELRSDLGVRKARSSDGPAADRIDAVTSSEMVSDPAHGGAKPGGQ